MQVLKSRRTSSTGKRLPQYSPTPYYQHSLILARSILIWPVLNIRPETGERPALHRLGAADFLYLTPSEMHLLCRKNKFLHGTIKRFCCHMKASKSLCTHEWNFCTREYYLVGGLGLITKESPYEQQLLPLLQTAQWHRCIVSLDLIAPHAGIALHYTSILSKIHDTLITRVHRPLIAHSRNFAQVHSRC